MQRSQKFRVLVSYEDEDSKMQTILVWEGTRRQWKNSWSEQDPVSYAVDNVICDEEG